MNSDMKYNTNQYQLRDFIVNGKSFGELLEVYLTKDT